MSADTSGGEPITAAGLAALDAEIQQLETVARREIAQRILAARELGDLSENADYHIAKEDQAHLETKIKSLRQRQRDAVIVESDTDAEVFGFGRTAEVLDEQGDKLHTWTLVGATEADVAQGRLSAQSPVGQALLGCPVGASVQVQTPRGGRSYRVQRIVS